jgi:hypothetical protein
MMRNMGASGMNGFPQGGMQNMGNNMPMGQPMGAPQMGSSQPMMTQQQMVQYQQQQQQQQQYRQSMRDLHKMNAGSPTSGDGSFNVGGPQGRVAQFAGNGAPDHRMNHNKAITAFRRQAVRGWAADPVEASHTMSQGVTRSPNIRTNS